jgi:tRNA pseudouridine55 synthase
VDAFDLERDPADAQNVRFRVVCSKGTYVRSLAHDLGRSLGTAAHLTALRREAIGAYRVDDAWQVGGTSSVDGGLLR